MYNFFICQFIKLWISSESVTISWIFVSPTFIRRLNHEKRFADSVVKRMFRHFFTYYDNLWYFWKEIFSFIHYVWRENITCLKQNERCIWKALKRSHPTLLHFIIAVSFIFTKLRSFVSFNSLKISIKCSLLSSISISVTFRVARHPRILIININATFRFQAIKVKTLNISSIEHYPTIFFFAKL